MHLSLSLRTAFLLARCSLSKATDVGLRLSDVFVLLSYSRILPLSPYCIFHFSCSYDFDCVCSACVFSLNELSHIIAVKSKMSNANNHSRFLSNKIVPGRRGLFWCNAADSNTEHSCRVVIVYFRDGQKAPKMGERWNSSRMRSMGCIVTLG